MRAGLVLVVLLAGLLAAAPPASAHAVALRTFPAPGASLDQAPAVVWVVLSEAPDLATFRLDVRDADHRAVPLGPVRVEHDRLVAALPPGLAPGGYVVKWSTLDAVDGHLVSGSWAFALGGAAAAGAASTSGSALSWPLAAGKALAFLGLALAAGGVATRAFVLADARLARVERAGAALLVAGLLLAGLAQARAAGMGVAEYALDARSGRALLARLALALAALAWLARASRLGAWARAVDLALVGASIVAVASASHAAAALGAWGAALDAIHLAAVAVWTGGLACLVLLLGDASAAARAAPRFSRLATACVLAMGATGVALFVALFGPDPRAWMGLSATPYGLLLAAMVLLGAAMAALGAANRFVHLARALRGSARGLRLNAGREAAVGAVVLLVAAGLTSLPPVLGGDEPLARSSARGTAEGVFAACADAAPQGACYVDVLMALQAERGPRAAFDVLADMAEANATFGAQVAHAVAHDLGRDALQNFGSVQATLSNCSERVFQGCIHGALQAYFEGLERVDKASIAGVCDLQGNHSRNVVRNCIHGIGHGVLVSTGFDLNATLDACDGLAKAEDRNDCHQGVFMENLDSYLANVTGVSRESAAGHDHHGEGEGHGVADPANPAYPCDAVRDAYRKACWTYQPALLHHFNRNDLRATARQCDALPGDEELRKACASGIGGMLAFSAGDDPVRMASYCAASPSALGRDACVRSFAATLVGAGGEAGLGVALCAQVTAVDQASCHEGLGVGARRLMGPEDAAELCRSVGAHEAACLRGATEPPE